ncbi:restriction endonuclease subunit S [Moraxella catarrhalis]|uniref:restriction endonuclease subunit S n=1 Tax=Moraxella catarrhalis TaxID=480 RepID=UPI0008030AFC|nr:restriction endonuclease subunit S [Moraxella catarrhalis]OBX45148.1 restriction endonuclease subunit M [Moraxella catarrhalis]
MHPFLQQLLQGQAVEWRTLGEVANYEQPTKYLVKSKDYDDDFKTPVLTAGKTFILGYTNETNGIYQASKNPVIIFDDFTTANKWVDFDFKAKSSAMKMISSVDENQFLLKYIYYWLNTLPSGLVDGDHKRQWISNFANKKIPIPPLSVQSQIVQILDTFTELTAELSMRQKQYQYYRDFLLSEHELAKVGFEWKSLGEVAIIKTGQPISKNKIANNEGVYPVINSGREPLGFINEWNTENDPIGITTRGAGVGSVTWQENKYFRGNLNYSVTIKDNSKLMVRFLYHILLEYEKQIHELCTFTGIPALNASNLRNLKIPIPPLSVQSEIVAILDTFDTLVSSISEGLPKEIQLRQKQYEYYRERLLNFDAGDAS